jgi:hypothetical protein
MSTWARVGSDGTLLASSGDVTGVNKFCNGRYNLTIASDISGAAFWGRLTPRVATIRDRAAPRFWWGRSTQILCLFTRRHLT